MNVITCGANRKTEAAQAAALMDPLTPAKYDSCHPQVAPELMARIAMWQEILGDAKLQMHLGSREVRDRVAPFLKKMELELHHAAAGLRHLEEGEECRRPQILQAIERSLLALEESFAAVQCGSEQLDD